MAIYRNPDDVRSAMVRSMPQWWLARSGDDIPDRDDLDPADFKALLPNILISDVEHDPFRIRYRLVGTREATGFNIVGRYLDELLPTDPDKPWMDDCLSHASSGPRRELRHHCKRRDLHVRVRPVPAVQRRQRDRAVRRCGGFTEI